MKHLIKKAIFVWMFFTAAAVVTFAQSGVAINATNFPDANFRAWVLAQPWGSDAYITAAEIDDITDFYISNLNISDLTGIEHFTGLQILECQNNQLTTLDASALIHLQFLNCDNNQITSLNVGSSIYLHGVSCNNNQLTSLDVSRLIVLKYLDCFNQTTSTLTLTAEGNGIYSLPIALNNPTGFVAGITYADGKLKSNSKAIGSTPFEVVVIGSDVKLKGTLTFLYTCIHNFSALGALVSEVTCVTPAKHKAICSLCGEEHETLLLEGAPAIGHNYKAVVTSPTCTEQGYTTYTSSCDGSQYVDNYVDAQGHNYKAVVTAPTCTKQGFTTYTSSCDGSQYVDNYVNALGHNFSVWQITTPAACGIAGEKIEKCAVCGAYGTKTEVIPALDHGYTAVVTSPTCIAGGFTTYTSACDGSKYTADEVAALGHKFGWVITTPATCATDGLKTVKCSVCGVLGEGTEVIPALGYQTKVTLPTCTEQGYTTFTCGDAVHTGDYVAALGHNFVWIVNPENKDEEIEICKRCGKLSGRTREFVDCIAVDEINFPDANFRAFISANFDNEKDGCLTYDQMQGIRVLDVSKQNIADLTGICYFVALQYLYVQDNKLITLDVSCLEHLKGLNYCGNPLTSVEIPTFGHLQHVEDCGDVVIPPVTPPTEDCLIAINAANFPDANFRTFISANFDNAKGGYLTCDQMQGIRVLNISDQNIADLTGICYFVALQYLYVQDNKLATLNVSCLAHLQGLNYCGNPLVSLNTGVAKWIEDCGDEVVPPVVIPPVTPPTEDCLIAVNAANFPDANFRAFITANFDNEKDGYLTCDQMLGIKVLNVSSQNIADLTGICYFVGLQEMFVQGNQLTTLNVSCLEHLKILDCSDNQLATLNVSGAVNLQYLFCQNNQLTTLDVSRLTFLKGLDCSNNLLVTLKASKLENLDYRGDKGTLIIEIGEIDESAIAINVYPNPTADKVHLSIDANVQLFTQQGALLYSGFGNEINLTNYPQGIYILKINGDKVVKVVKL